ncbi:MFS transporter [Paenibacillus bovis]|uniref:Arabinose ABC transporter permease n=1 Tax=Paenibacillus bovis TaxID=1616788 RepID=A0A172ZIG1_9BACL|nr:MFS transporter [Paenibacillus bovis]ANF97077.1 arabinose ABC transporter permease [Paenibacillus bovis]
MYKQNKLLILILMIGAFGIINTEMGVIGILPYIAERFDISVSRAGWLVSLFALTVAVSGPTMPLLFSGINGKKAMLLVLGVFVVSNIVAIFTSNFAVAMIARVIPAIFHPVYFSAAFTIAAESVHKKEAPKAISKVFIGVSAGMVLGVPIASFLASAISYQISMSFFAIVNAIVFVAILAFFPSMPVKEKLSYGAQLSVLKKPAIWLSIGAVILLNSAVFGVYSYLAEYLGTVTRMSGSWISIMLAVFGGANIIGNIVAGKLLTNNANRSVVVFPFVLGFVYLLLLLLGQFTVPMAIITVFWGILAGIAGNINQYWITSAARKAPEFANGLFLASVNLGTTIGTAAGGLFISTWGNPYVVWVGILSLILSAVFIMLRISLYDPVKSVSRQ